MGTGCDTGTRSRSCVPWGCDTTWGRTHVSHTCHTHVTLALRRGDTEVTAVTPRGDMMAAER